MLFNSIFGDLRRGTAEYCTFGKEAFVTFNKEHKCEIRFPSYICHLTSAPVLDIMK